MNNLTIAIQRALLVGLVALGILLNWAITGFAADKTVPEMPSDIGRWMTTWRVLPETVREVGEEHGPLAAVLYGSAKGAARFAEVTAKEALDAVSVDRGERAKRSRGGSEGLVLRYDF